MVYTNLNIQHNIRNSYATPVQEARKEDSLGSVVVVGANFFELEVLPLLRIQGAFLLLRSQWRGALKVGIGPCANKTETEEPGRGRARLLGGSGGRRVPPAGLGGLKCR